MLKVLKPGLHITVQDLGKPGLAHYGITAGGAADALSLRAGNLMLGNDESAAALEMTLLGGTFEADQDLWVVLTGAEFESNAVFWHPLLLPAGRKLRVGTARTGARCYLCVRGGLIPADDGCFLVGPPNGKVHRGGPAPLFDRSRLRVTQGSHASWFDDAIYQHPYRVSPDSNRRGVRLQGPALAGSRTILSEGVSAGAIQVPPDGQPIIIFVDQQTVGGYPKIANVISADLHLVGQLRPGDEVRFTLVSLEEAISELRRQKEWLQTFY